MQKAGGIIAIIAGVFSVLAAFMTLAVGGVGSAVKADGANTVVGLGWGGMLFAFLVIVLGAVGMGAKTRTPGALLMISSVLGAVLGGTFVALFMILSFIGGVLVLIGSKKANTVT